MDKKVKSVAEFRKLVKSTGATVTINSKRGTFDMEYMYGDELVTGTFEYLHKNAYELEILLRLSPSANNGCGCHGE